MHRYYCVGVGGAGGKAATNRLEVARHSRGGPRHQNRRQHLLTPHARARSPAPDASAPLVAQADRGRSWLCRVGWGGVLLRVAGLSWSRQSGAGGRPA